MHSSAKPSYIELLQSRTLICPCGGCGRMLREFTPRPWLVCPKCRSVNQFCVRCDEWLPNFFGYFTPKRCGECGDAWRPVPFPLPPKAREENRWSDSRARPLASFTSYHFHLADKHRKAIQDEHRYRASGCRKVAAWERMERQRRISFCPSPVS